MDNKKINYYNSELNTTEQFEGESIEDKVRRTTETKAPIEAVSPMIYTERKDGVRKDTNIRTDKFDIAQEAMSSISNGIRTRRDERIKGSTKENTKVTAQPDANSKTSVQQEN